MSVELPIAGGLGRASAHPTFLVYLGHINEIVGRKPLVKREKTLIAFRYVRR
jgi:hypothetical protein